MDAINLTRASLNSLFKRLGLLGISLLLFVAPKVNAAVFTCPSEAYLAQYKQAKQRIHSIDLSTGTSTVDSDQMNFSSGINAMGYNQLDGYFWAYSKQHQKLIRFEDQFNYAQVTISGDPLSGGFPAGDISPFTNKYYLSGGGGVYRIDVDFASPTYLVSTRLRNTLGLNLFDVAVHPDTGVIWGVVGNTGNLVQMDPDTGDLTTVKSMGITGTFGAGYFDVNGNLYIGENSSGTIYRIDVNSTDPSYVVFATGPAASTNDGARCASAPIVGAATVDFGDAPDSYGTSLESNGPRHAVSELYFGSSVDGETDSTSYPATEASDDGVTFATDSQAGETAVVQLVSSGTGKVDAWIDFNQNQQFDAEEQVLTNHDVSSGTSSANIVVPTLAEDGTTWARFRLSEEGNLAPTGGAQNGEVEDFEVSITGESLTCVSYPSSATYSTVVFEDNWPFMGDFDFNDAVAELRTTRCSTAGSVHVARVNGQITAMGAGYHNGLAIHIPGVDRADVSELFSSFTVNSVADTFPMVAGTTDAVFQLDNDLRVSHPKSGGCNFFRTESGCAASVLRTFELKVALDDPIPVASFPTGIWDPFLYATPSAARGVGSPGTSLEIHLKNKSLTSLGSSEFFGTGQDASDAGNSLYYQNASGLPWAIEVPSGWKHPVEGIDISTAYPDFAGYAMSGGAVNTDWYSSEKATSGKFYDQE